MGKGARGPGRGAVGAWRLPRCGARMIRSNDQNTGWRRAGITGRARGGMRVRPIKGWKGRSRRAKDVDRARGKGRLITLTIALIGE